MIRLVDMHCHLDRIADPQITAYQLAERGIAVFCTTVTPEEARVARDSLAAFPMVRVGVGLHPWWVSSGSCGENGPELAAWLTDTTDYVGEVGLDFSSEYSESKDAQVEAFEAIIRTCAEHPREGRVISIHAVRSAATVLDILERHGMPEQTHCIFHWFSGTSDDLARLRALGCYISVNEHMLATKRGREYARQIPLGQLLIETDAPPQLDAPYSPTCAVSPQTSSRLPLPPPVRACSGCRAQISLTPHSPTHIVRCVRRLHARNTLEE